MSPSTVPSRQGISLLLIPTAKEYAAVATALGAPPEAAPWEPLEPTLAGPGLALVMSGIGKANAAGAAATALGRLQRPRALICLGVAGALPAEAPLKLGDVVIASDSLFLDEGVQTPEGFLTCEDLRFPIGPPRGAIPADPGLAALLGPLAHRSGPIATISTCAGTRDLARQRAAAAIAEAMEGAAAGLVAWRLGIPFAEVRVVSNTTGDRADQIWDLDGALRRLAETATAIAAALR